mgnify:CR=1 FL=1
MTTIKLTYPVTHEDKTISELEMRRPTVRDHIWLDHQKAAFMRDKKVLDDVEKDAKMYARLCDVDEAVIHQMDMSDWGKCRVFYLNCVVPSQPSQEKTETD